MMRDSIILMAWLCVALTVGCERETRVESSTSAAPKDPTPTAREDKAADREADAVPAGERVDSAVAYDIYKLLGQVVNAAVKPGTFDDLIERFSSADRDRFKGVRGGALDAESTPVRDAWKSRYEGEFTIDDSPAAFSPIVRIESIGQSEGKEQARVFVQPPTGVSGPQIELMLIKENTWRLDVPDHFDTETLRQAIAQTLTKMHQSHGSWPTELMAGEQYVGYHVLAAIAGVDPATGLMPGQTPGRAAPGQKPAPGQTPGGAPR